MTLNRRKSLNIALLVAAAIGLGTLSMEICRKPAEAGNPGMVCRGGHVVVACTNPIGGNIVTRGGPVPLPGGKTATSVGVGGNTTYRLYVLDTRTQCLIVYSYDPDRNYLGLAAGRKVMDDLCVTEYRNKGITVKQVKELVEKVRKR